MGENGTRLGACEAGLTKGSEKGADTYFSCKRAGVDKDHSWMRRSKQEGSPTLRI